MAPFKQELNSTDSVSTQTNSDSHTLRRGADKSIGRVRLSLQQPEQTSDSSSFNGLTYLLLKVLQHRLCSSAFFCCRPRKKRVLKWPLAGENRYERPMSALICSESAAAHDQRYRPPLEGFLKFMVHSYHTIHFKLPSEAQLSAGKRNLTACMWHRSHNGNRYLDFDRWYSRVIYVTQSASPSPTHEGENHSSDG